MGTLADGRRVFVWGGLPGETVEIESTKAKSKYVEAIATKVIEPSPDRVAPQDAESYLSTSPWQIMKGALETQWKKQLIRDAYTLHHIDLPDFELVSDRRGYGYRNKVEFSWWWDNDREQLDLAFFRRGTHGKIPVKGMALARPEINELAIKVRDILRTKKIEARDLKTLIIRCNQQGNTVFQLYVKDNHFHSFDENDFDATGAQGGEVIYSDPRSPASRITKRLAAWGDVVLTDEILGVPFRYATEGFFQVNLPVYERALEEMKKWVETGKKVIDLYSGVGTIGLTIGGDNATMIEIDEHAVREMNENIKRLGKDANAILSSAEYALDHLESEATIILDPPRAGLHQDVVDKLLELKPERIIYLSCNPVTQARDVQMLLPFYDIVQQQGYNFFPRTPHIENLLVLQSK